MEIDVTYCKFARLNDVCASPINKQECKCSKIPIQMCYYKQLQQYKQCLDEIEEILLQTTGDSQLSCILAKSNILQLIKQAKEGGE